MNSGNIPDIAIHHLAHTLASDVIGFAAIRMAEMMDGPDKEVMNSWEREEVKEFMEVYLHHVTDAINIQITAISRFKE